MTGMNESTYIHLHTYTCMYVPVCMYVDVYVCTYIMCPQTHATEVSMGMMLGHICRALC